MHVTNLNPRQTACIALLEDLLQEARDGKVLNLACAYSGPEGVIGSCYDGLSFLQLVGAVEVLKQESVQAYLSSEDS